MIRLEANTAAQEFVATWGEKRRFLPLFTHYLMEVMGTNYEARYIVADVVEENVRYTKVLTGTDVASISTFELHHAGQFLYKVWGQNSATNLDPNDAAVVGVVEYGVLQIDGNAQFFEPHSPSPTNDIVYNG